MYEEKKYLTHTSVAVSTESTDTNRREGGLSTTQFHKDLLHKRKNFFLKMCLAGHWYIVKFREWNFFLVLHLLTVVACVPHQRNRDQGIFFLSFRFTIDWIHCYLFQIHSQLCSGYPRTTSERAPSHCRGNPLPFLSDFRYTRQYSPSCSNNNALSRTVLLSALYTTEYSFRLYFITCTSKASEYFHVALLRVPVFNQAKTFRRVKL